MRAAIYIRVSTSRQNTDLQKDGLVEYAQRAKLHIEKEYVDIAVSGRKEGRSALRQLMKAARNREFDTVLVWKFDRFARSVSHLLKALEEFNHLGIRFISVQGQIDTDSPMGKAMAEDVTGCAAGLCCPVMVTAKDCCKPEICLPFSMTIKRGSRQ